MLFSLCEWGDDNVLEWGGDVGQMWRVQVTMPQLPAARFSAGAAVSRSLHNASARWITFPSGHGPTPAPARAMAVARLRLSTMSAL